MSADGITKSARDDLNNRLYNMETCPGCGNTDKLGMQISLDTWEEAEVKYHCPVCETYWTEIYVTQRKLIKKEIGR